MAPSPRTSASARGSPSATPGRFGLNGADINAGAGNDTLEGGAGADELFGDAGSDTASYIGSPDGVIVSLITGTGLNGDAAGDVLVDIENLFGSVHDDALTGDDGDNALSGSAGNDALSAHAGDDALFGGDGDDTLYGGAGADVLDGGAGTDMGNWSGSAAGVEVNLATGTAAGGDAAGDIVTGIEDLMGSVHADTLTGDNGGNLIIGLAGNDTLTGRGGDDTLIGNEGADAMHGGSGVHDVIDYSGSAAGVAMQLDGSAGTGGDAQGDTALAIENIVGSSFDDNLIGNTVRNTIMGGSGDDDILLSSNLDTAYGGAGNDTINGGRGADLIDGGAGTDRATYSNSDLRVFVDLGAGTAIGSGHGSGDTLVSIEDVFGSAFDDTITGDAGDNWIDGFRDDDAIFGGAGNDSLRGGHGADTIEGGAGDDRMHGGTGADVFVYTSSTWGADAITGWQNGTDLLDLTAAGLGFADFTISQVNADTVLELTADPTQTITLLGINAASIDGADFA